MFARTKRLILRPGWPEDAPQLVRALNQRDIARNLTSIPMPYGQGDALNWIESKADPRLPRMLAFARTRGAPRLVGGCGVSRRADGRLELGYWIDRAHWGLGFATEAAGAVMQIARAENLGPIHARHFVDNAASGQVLRKIGFRPTGHIGLCHSKGRSEPALAAFFEDDGEAALCRMPVDSAFEIYRDAMLAAA